MGCAMLLSFVCSVSLKRTVHRGIVVISNSTVCDVSIFESIFLRCCSVYLLRYCGIHTPPVYPSLKDKITKTTDVLDKY